MKYSTYFVWREFSVFLPISLIAHTGQFCASVSDNATERVAINDVGKVSQVSRITRKGDNNVWSKHGIK